MWERERERGLIVTCLGWQRKVELWTSERQLGLIENNCKTSEACTNKADCFGADTKNIIKLLF